VQFPASRLTQAHAIKQVDRVSSKSMVVTPGQTTDQLFQQRSSAVSPRQVHLTIRRHQTIICCISEFEHHELLPSSSRLINIKKLRGNSSYRFSVGCLLSPSDHKISWFSSLLRSFNTSCECQFFTLPSVTEEVCEGRSPCIKLMLIH